MTPEDLADLTHLRRPRDLLDRDYARPAFEPVRKSGAEVLQEPASQA